MKEQDTLIFPEATKKAEETRQALLKKAEELAKAAPKFLKRYTLDGVVLVKEGGGDLGTAGKMIEVPNIILKEEAEIPPNNLKTLEIDMMLVIYTAITDLKTNPKLKGRAIPLTRNELLNPTTRSGITDLGFSKSVLKSLEKKKLLEVDIIKLVNTKSKKHTGARTVVYFTQKGRTHVRRYIDPEYKAPFEQYEQPDTCTGGGDSAEACSGRSVQPQQKIDGRPEKEPSN